MNLKMTALIATGLLGAASLALAQTGTSNGSNTSSTSSMSSSSSSDTTSNGKMTHKAFLKECMQMGKSANNGMSKEDMRKSCHAQLKKYEAGEQQEPMAPQPNQ